MAASTAKHLIKTLFNCRGSYRLENVRYATGLRKSKRLGKVPELARTFEQRLAGIEKKRWIPIFRISSNNLLSYEDQIYFFHI